MLEQLSCWNGRDLLALCGHDALKYVRGHGAQCTSRQHDEGDEVDGSLLTLDLTFLPSLKQLAALNPKPTLLITAE